MLLVLAAAAIAQLRESAPSSTDRLYRVVPWPDDTSGDRSYTEVVERKLNDMAAEGYRFHSGEVGLRVPMMVFIKGEK